MDHFLYRDGQLYAEDVPVAEIAAKVGTPFYVYSAATLTRHFRLFDEALDGTDHLVCYAMKANSNLAIIKLLGDLGAGMDVVSIGEYHRARAAGVPGDRIVFSGVGKTRAEMRTALEGGIRQFNLESEPEMEALSQVAVSLGAVAPVPIVAGAAGEAVTGKELTDGVLDEAAELAATASRPIDDIRATREYRLELVKVLVRRVLRAAEARAAWSE